MNVTVYSKPNCVQCDTTYRAFLTVGIPFEVIPLDRDAIDFVMGLGHLQAPVVVAGDMNWAGYRPDQIKELATKLADQGVELTPLNIKEDKVTIDNAIKDLRSKTKEATLATT